MAANSPAMEQALPGSGNKPLSKPAHALALEAVIQELQADDDAGLTPADAKDRLDVYGTNDLGEGGGVQPAKILLRQVANAMTLVTCTTSPIYAVRSLIHWLTGAHLGHGRELWYPILD